MRNIWRHELEKTPLYETKYGQAFYGDSLELLEKLADKSINLVITSPPFALLRQKEYGNKTQEEYVRWISSFSELVFDKLKEDGSFVLDLGGAYQKGMPVRSLYNFRVLLHLCDEIGFHLAEDFYWFNPSKLPSPIEWVNKRKIRVKDAVNTIWWLSKTPYPKANIKNVLLPYSDRMQKLLMNPGKFYKAKKRPSGHDIGNGFGQDNGDAIPPNLLQISNSESNSRYTRACKAIGIKTHPARFPMRLPKFFIEMLTDPGDVVLDIFSGSNTTGEVCEKLGRHWLACDNNKEYLAASAFRFISSEASNVDLQAPYKKLISQNVSRCFSEGKNGGKTIMENTDIFESLKLQMVSAIV